MSTNDKGDALQSLQQAVKDCLVRTNNHKTITIEVCGPTSNRDLYLNLFPILLSSNIVFDRQDQYGKPYKETSVDITIQDFPVSELQALQVDDLWRYQCHYDSPCVISRTGPTTYTTDFSPSSPVLTSLSSYSPRSPLYSRFLND